MTEARISRPQWILERFFGKDLGERIKKRIRVTPPSPEELYQCEACEHTPTTHQLVREMEEDGLLERYMTVEDAHAYVNDLIRSINERYCLPLEVPIETIPLHASAQMMGRYREKIRFYHRVIPVGGLCKEFAEYLRKLGTGHSLNLLLSLSTDVDRERWWQGVLRAAAEEKIEMLTEPQQILRQALKDSKLPVLEEKYRGQLKSDLRVSIAQWSRDWEWKGEELSSFLTHLGWTEKKLANYLKVSPKTLRDVLEGKFAFGGQLAERLDDLAKKKGGWIPRS